MQQTAQVVGVQFLLSGANLGTGGSRVTIQYIMEHDNGCQW